MYIYIYIFTCVYSHTHVHINIHIHMMEYYSAIRKDEIMSFVSNMEGP